MRRPRLEQTTFQDENGDTKTLNEDQVDELQAIDSFWNYCQNWFGPPALVGSVDITTTHQKVKYVYSKLENSQINLAVHT